MTKPIYPCLWFNNEAEQAAEYYCSIFKDSKILSRSPIVVMFELNGSKFMALNGGPKFKFDEAISFVINCETQTEIDYHWDALLAGGEESMCGWLKDKFGISWQIVPPVLGQMLTDKDKTKAGRVMHAMMQMKKIIIADLKKAYNN